MVAVIAAMGGQVERHRQAHLALRQVAPVEGVGILRRGEAGILPDRPWLGDIHGGIGPPDIGRYSRPAVDKIEAGNIFGPVGGGERDAFRGDGGARGWLEALRRQLRVVIFRYDRLGRRFDPLRQPFGGERGNAGVAAAGLVAPPPAQRHGENGCAGGVVREPGDTDDRQRSVRHRLALPGSRLRDHRLDRAGGEPRPGAAARLDRVENRQGTFHQGGGQRLDMARAARRIGDRRQPRLLEDDRLGCCGRGGARSRRPARGRRCRAGP